MASGISVLDFIPPGLHAAIADYSSTDDVTTYFQAAAVAANNGQVGGEAIGGAVFVPNGLYRVDRIGIRDTVFFGESREGAIVRALTAGSSSQFMFDAMLDRDGVTKNTRGRGWAQTLTIDADDTGRSCLRVYGGGVDCHSLNLQNGSVGLSTGLPIWSSFRNIHSLRNDVGFFTFHDVPGDIGTSATFIDCWADTCTTYGFRITQLAYSSFISCVAQDCGVHNWFIDGNAGGVPAVYSLIFLTCASEGSGTPFYMKKVRDLTLLNPRIIGSPAVDYVVFDDAQGSLRDFSAIAAPSPGKYHLRVLNHTSGTGSILLDNSVVTYDPADDIFFTITGGDTNGRKRAQQYEYRLNNVIGAQRMTADTGDVDGYSGLRILADDGTRVAAFRRIGTPVFLTNGAILSPADNLSPGEVSFHLDGANLRFVAKDAAGVVRSGVVTLT